MGMASDDFDVVSCEVVEGKTPLADVEEGHVAGSQHEVGLLNGWPMGHIDGGRGRDDREAVVVDHELHDEVRAVGDFLEHDP